MAIAPIEQLKLIRDNPGVYRFIDDEQLADLLLQLLETKRLFKKAKVELKNGVDGKDGKTPVAGVDYMSREQQERLIKDLVFKITLPEPKHGKDGKDGKDAEITPELVQELVDLVLSKITFPEEKSPQELRDFLELLQDDERLDKKAIRGIEKIEEDIKELQERPVGKGGGGLGKRQVSDLIDTAIGALDTDSTPEFEKVNKNLSSYPASYNYTGDDLTSIDYTTGAGTITKTFNYSGNDLSSIVLSGSLPVGLTETTKTFTYSGGNLVSVAYS